MKLIGSDELWAVVAPLLPPARPHPRGGRPRIPDRAAFPGIVVVLRTGIPWEGLPQELGWGSGMTGWRRLRDWQQAGVGRRLHRVLLHRLGDADQIDWSRAGIDSAMVPAQKGGRPPARIQRIGASRARSAMGWPTARAARWPWTCRRPR